MAVVTCPDLSGGSDLQVPAVIGKFWACVCACVCAGMVQPQPDGPMQWDMSGDESGGVLRVPPELAANEVVTRLLSDNQQLRGNACELWLR